MLNNYIFVFVGGESPPTAEQANKHFEKFQQWLIALGDAVVSPAIPFKDTHTVKADGTTEEGTSTAISGLSIFAAANMEDALKIAQSCPFLEIGGTLEVSEMIDAASQAH